MENNIVGLSEFESKRLKEIKKIIKLGKVVRFHLPGGGYKDVDNCTIDEGGDMKSFRMSDGLKTPYVCWWTGIYTISSVDR